MRLLALAVVALAGCSDPHDALAKIHPTGASLDAVNRDEIYILGGGGIGSGTLHINEVSGAKWAVPVSLNGGSLGVMMAIDNNGGDFAIDFAPGDVADGNDLLGTYQGVQWDASMAFGAAGYDLENEKFVKLHGIGFSESLIGLYVGHTWLGVDVDGDVSPAK